DRSTYDTGVTRHHAASLYRRRRDQTFQPARYFAVLLPRRALRRRQLRDLEPWVHRQQPHEHLADGSRGAEDCHGPFVFAHSRNGRRRHLANSVLASRSYVSTLLLSSSTSMYSSGV